MATSKTSRVTIPAPLSVSAESPRSFRAENIFLRQDQDPSVGNAKYAIPRFSLSQTIQLSDVNATTIYDAGFLPVPYVGSGAESYIVATNENIYTGDSPHCVDALLSGATQINYSATAGDGVLKVMPYEQVALGKVEFLVIRKQASGIVYEVDITVPSATSRTLGFTPQLLGVSLDGYLFLAEAGTDTINNSALNDLSTWTLGVNYIKASQVPGAIVALVRQNNFVVALKTASVEYFYNAGITNSSPLQRNTSYTKAIGMCPTHTEAAVSFRDNIFFVTGNSYESFNICRISPDQSMSLIGTEDINTYISQVEDSFTPSRLRMFSFVWNKKDFIVLCDTKTGAGTPTRRNYFYIFDMSSNVWSKVSFEGTDFQTGLTPQAAANRYLYNSTRWACRASDWSRDYISSETDGSSFISSCNISPTFMGTGNRKFLNTVSVNGILPDGYEVTCSVNKKVGGNRQTVTHTYDNMDNLNSFNFGQFVSADITITFTDADVDGGLGGPTDEIRLDGLVLEVTNGNS